MIFLVLILFIVLIVMGLNMLDNNNLDKIKNHLEAKNCSEIYYGYGSYKGLCQADVRLIENSFSLDIEKNEKVISYESIASLEHKKQKVILTLKSNNTLMLEFKKEQEAQEYYEKIQEKI